MTCSDDEFQYRIRVRTDSTPSGTRWTFKYSNGTAIEIVWGEYFLGYYEHNHRGCLPLDDCFEFYIEAFGALCCNYGNGGYTVFANDVVMAEGGEGVERDWSETKTFCYGPSVSSSPSILPTKSSHPSSNPSTHLVCEENEFKYEVYVTTDRWPTETSWELKYDDGTLIDSVEQEEYTEKYTEHVHEGCLDLDSCVIFTIFDSVGDGICCGWGNGGYTIFADYIVKAEGGEFNFEETKTFCYGPSYSFSPSSNPSTLNPTSSNHPSSRPITVFPTSTNQICWYGSNNHGWCGWWASIGLCEDNNVKDWMQENCAKACSNCCMDYYEYSCDDDASDGRCTDTSQLKYYDGITWKEWMHATCRSSCDTCGLDFTPSPTPPVTCSDDKFKYEIIVTNDNSYDFEWYLYYKYPDLIDQYQIDGSDLNFPPNYFFPYAQIVCVKCYVF